MPEKKPEVLGLIFCFSITCQAGNDQDQKGFCAVYSTLVRLTSMSCSYTDADMEKVEKKCLDACKKVGKENNSHKEARKKMCKAYGIYSHTMTLPAKCNYIKFLLPAAKQHDHGLG